MRRQIEALFAAGLTARDIALTLGITLDEVGDPPSAIPTDVKQAEVTYRSPPLAGLAEANALLRKRSRRPFCG